MRKKAADVIRIDWERDRFSLEMAEKKLDRDLEREKIAASKNAGGSDETALKLKKIDLILALGAIKTKDEIADLLTLI